MSWRAAMTLMVLAVLILLPPVAMAFDLCAGMGQMCEAQCGASVSALVAPVDSAPLALLARVEAQPVARVPASFVSSVEPPPKRFLSPA